MPLDPIRFRQNIATANTDDMPSPEVWHDCPFEAILLGAVPGRAYHWDFGSFRTAADVNAAEGHWQDGLKVYGSGGAPIAPLDVMGGGITVSSDGDNEGVGIGQMGYPFQISRSHKKLWFEIRLKKSTIADTKHGFFTGLIEATALSATVPIAAAGTLTDNNFVGFHCLEGDGDAIDTVYKANTVTQVTVGADAKVIAADTFYKLGFVFDPDFDPSVSDTAGTGLAKHNLTFYVDNVRLATRKQIPTAAGTDFPNDVRLGFVFALLNATGSTPGSTSLSWARVAQLI